MPINKSILALISHKCNIIRSINIKSPLCFKLLRASDFMTSSDLCENTLCSPPFFPHSSNHDDKSVLYEKQPFFCYPHCSCLK